MVGFTAFDDPATEREYVVQLRRSHLPTLRILGAIGFAFLVVFIWTAQLYFPREIQPALTAFGFAMMLIPGLALTSFPEKYFPEYPQYDALWLSTQTVACVGLFVWFDAVGFSLRPVDAMAPVVIWAALLIAASATYIANVRMFVLWATSFLLSFIIVLWLVDLPFVTKLYQFFLLTLFYGFALYMSWSIDRHARAAFSANKEVEAERAKSEELLYNVLPAPVAKRLQSGEAVADSFGDVSVVFADVVGFSRLARELSPGHLVRLLNDIFLIADECAARHGLEKVKTIGDAYLAVAGGTVSSGSKAREAVSFGCDLIERVGAMSREANVDLKLRVGVHTGPVIGGVVGSSRLTYDYWGDTMNLASRIESVAEPNGVAVSKATYYECGGTHDFGPAQICVLKGIGEQEVRHVVV
jgi:class 3 adenylate cyclase